MESINSMYLWYQRSTICYAVLSDLPADADLEDSLSKCRWFTRGWTLQELIAPSRMTFFDAAWKGRGSKQSLADIISAMTRIDTPLLCGKTTLSTYSVAQRMSWAAPRQTTRVEDTAYYLFGIFALNLPLLYGEGRKAFRRLQAEILRTIPDLSILAWRLCPINEDDQPMTDTKYRHIFNPDSQDLVLSGVLATSPAEFYSCLDLVTPADDTIPDVSISSFGIKLRTRLLLCPILGTDEEGYVLPLNCMSGSRHLGIHLRQIGRQKYLRGDPRTLLQYFDVTKLSIVQPEERHLLLELPSRSGYQDFRLGHARRILPTVRSRVLYICPPEHITLREPWPLGTFDHQDGLFSMPMPTRYDFSCVKISANIPAPLGEHEKSPLTFKAWICAFGWSSESTTQFSIIEFGPSTDEIFEDFFVRVAGSDYNINHMKTLLDSCSIPRRSTAVCPIENSDFVAVVTIHLECIKDLDLCQDFAWIMTIRYNIHRSENILAVKTSSWRPSRHVKKPHQVTRFFAGSSNAFSYSAFAARR
ncbi:hypothetical protein FB567DRAFT_508899 [Paraphoma chrysanthemicola]|uniref:DUF8212 domain-containing protein n=1 Tax=Paraphoma chrysanthemicola TaxID=798071 RepID=A0A8K0QSE5_9PLEO|nr:hypothetical protein FB567DRAFT_508899 [Paraphoma chrysanthemicola]